MRVSGSSVIRVTLRCKRLENGRYAPGVSCVMQRGRSWSSIAVELKQIDFEDEFEALKVAKDSAEELLQRRYPGAEIRFTQRGKDDT